jgi:hypothetical protein
VYFEVHLKNLLWNISEHTHTLAARIYTSDGSLYVETTYQAVVKPEWGPSMYTLGWGSVEAGNWPVGTYRVEILIDGRLVTEGYFTIY